MEASTKPDRIREKVDGLKESHRLMAISAVDEPEGITLCYHFWRLEDKEVLNLKVKVGGEEIRTISDIIPNALNYEREIHDLFGVEFEGAKLEPLLIPKGYKKYPLRKAIKVAVQSARTGSSNQRKR
jgi:NADH:ubiquinone oxidoreductase subunit C